MYISYANSKFKKFKFHSYKFTPENKNTNQLTTFKVFMTLAILSDLPQRSKAHKVKT